MKFLDEIKKWIEKWEKVIKVISIIVTILFGLLQIVDVKTIVTSTKNDVISIKEQTEKQFRITYPNGGIVEITDMVIGVTPYPNRNHYIVVTSIETGDDWIQDGPVKISIGYVWTGRAIFGSAAVGAGKRFVIRAIATNSILSPGTLTEVPEDAIFSESVAVTRKKTNESS